VTLVGMSRRTRFTSLFQVAKGETSELVGAQRATISLTRRISLCPSLHSQNLSSMRGRDSAFTNPASLHLGQFIVEK
jgi:hypothetical protein